MDIVDRAAQSALDRYDLRGARIEQRYAGECNVVYRVSAGALGEFALRVSTYRYLRGTDVESDRAEIAAELHWLSALRHDTDIRAPVPLAARDGSLVQGIADPATGRARLCVLLSWVAGEEVETLTDDHLRRIGVVIARLHDHALRFAQDGHAQRPTNDWTRLAPDIHRALGEATWVADGDGETIRAAADKLATTVAAMPRGEQFSLIHADVQRRNVRFVGADIGVFDFDECVLGFHVADIAKPLINLPLGRERDSQRDALFSGYQSVRALPEACSQRIESIRFAYRQLVPMAWALNEPNRAMGAENTDILAAQVRACREYLRADV
ncbi:hypothetical protein CMK11_22195 [Candidatus Poribacteria bacterium]|nr:hypothetical protein [Candidatus Poribacteria bacterium]